VNNKDSKPRPVKVALTEADEKHRIKNLSRNKEIPMDRPFRKMSVTHDMRFSYSVHYCVLVETISIMK
jgi:hypothetical protein